MKFPLKCPFALLALLALFSGLSRQATADAIASPLKLCAQPKSRCQKVKETKVKLCTWKGGACKPKACSAFKKTACSKVSHCEYKPKMKECVPKEAQEESNGSCERDLAGAKKMVDEAEERAKKAEERAKAAEESAQQAAEALERFAEALKRAIAEAESGAQWCGIGTLWNGTHCVANISTNISTNVSTNATKADVFKPCPDVTDSDIIYGMDCEFPRWREGRFMNGFLFRTVQWRAFDNFSTFYEQCACKVLPM